MAAAVQAPASDTVVREFTGYTYKQVKGTWHKPSDYVAMALVWLAVGFIPRLSIPFMSANAVQMPKLAAALLRQCPLQQAKYVLVKLIDGRELMVSTQKYIMSPPVEGCGGRFEQDAGCDDQITTDVGSSQTMRKHQRLLVFKLFLRQYVYCSLHGTFEALPGMPTQLPERVRRVLHTLHAIDSGADWSRFNAEQVVARRNMLQLYGNKKWLFSRSQLYSAASRHAMPMLFGVQTIELFYLLYQQYWYYVLVMASFDVVGLIGLMKVLWKQHALLIGLINRNRMVPLVQAGWIRATISHRLVPGDVIVLQRGKATCDMVLLRGSCLVEESMLSGEAAQVRKSRFVPDQGREYHPDSHHTSTIYAGTMIKQVWNVEDAEDEVLAMVVRTGLNTTMGAMVRQLIAPISVRKEKQPFEPDLLRLYKFAFFLQLFTLIPYSLRAYRYKEPASNIINKVLETLVQSAPPPVVAIMLLCGFAAVLRLKKHGIKLLYPEMLKLGASCDVVCFDKTGTLTGTTSQLHGIVPVADGQFQVLQQNATGWSNKLKQALASCHGLTMINRIMIVGDEVEKSLFKAVEAQYKDRSIIMLPRQPDKAFKESMVSLRVLRVLDFDSQTLKSGVVVTSDDAAADSAFLFIKGAPSVIKDTVLAASVPSNYEQVTDELSSKAFRLMALAVGVLPRVSALDVQRLSQQQLEKRAHKLELLGLIVLTNPIKPDSRNTVTELQDKGGIRTMIITGDYHHTALATAQDVGMIPPKARIIVIDTAIPPPQLASPLATPTHSVRSSLDEVPAHSRSSGLASPVRASVRRQRPGHSISFMQSPTVRCSNLERGLRHSVSHNTMSTALRDSQGGQQGGSPATAGVGCQRFSCETAQPSAFSAPVMQHGLHSAQPDDYAQQQRHQQSAVQSSRHSLDSSSRQQRSPGGSHPQSRVQQRQQTPLEVFYAATQAQSDSKARAGQARDSPLLPPQQTLQGEVVIEESSQSLPHQQHSNTEQQQQSLIQQQQQSLMQQQQQPPMQQKLPMQQQISAQQQQQQPHAQQQQPHAQQQQQQPHAQQQQQPHAQQQQQPHAQQQQPHAQQQQQPHAQQQQQQQSGMQQQQSPLQLQLPMQQPPTDSQHPPAVLASHNNGQHNAEQHQADSPLLPLGKLPTLPLTPSHSGRKFLPPLVTTPTTRHLGAPTPTPGVDGLRFVFGLGNKTLTPMQALSALAEGHMQCAVTGAAFQHLVESDDLAPLEIVMRSAVVLARMQPHQKGKAVELLGVNGLHQMHEGAPRHVQGLGCTVMFVGDGINDLVALSTADIGFAVGATDAMVAASVSTSRSSVAGVLSFIKEGKGGHSLILSLFRYMVVYYLAVAMSQNLAFFVDGSEFSTIQRYALDLQAISLAFLATILPPVDEMTRHRPPAYVGIRRTYILVTVMTALWAFCDVGSFAFLLTRPWVGGGNGTAVDNPVNTYAWLTANFQLLGPVISLSVDTRLFVKPIYKTGFYIPVAIVYLILSTLAIMLGPVHKANILHLALYPQHFRFQMEALAIAAVVLFWAVVNTTRRMINRFEHSQISPV